MFFKSISLALCLSLLGMDACYGQGGSGIQAADPRGNGSDRNESTPAATNVAWDVPSTPKPDWLLKATQELEATEAEIKAIESKLDRSYDFQFENVSLRAAMAAISKEFEITIVFDEAAMEGGISTPDDPVDFTLKELQLRKGLHMILKMRELTYAIESGVLVITTNDVGDAQCLRHYDVSHVLPDSKSATDLIDVIEKHVPGDWYNSDSISRLGSTIIITASIETHDEVTALLARLSRIPRETFASPVK
jgi:hypothetical protein